jgi:flagellar motor switch/type III secretory pathway protein FliN
VIRVLVFDPPAGPGSRALRTSRFLPRSTIPIAALCVVANGIREHLRHLLGIAAEVTFGEAVPLSDVMRARLVAGAHCFLTRGRLSDVLLFIGEEDARRLVATAFDERAVDRALSALERATLARLVHELAVLFDPLCAERYAPPLAVGPEAAAGCVNYVDMRIGPPIGATLGVGMTREPIAVVSGGPTISAQLLDDVFCEARAEIATGTMTAAGLASLAPGTIVRMDTKVGANATLKVGGHSVARGRGGVVMGEGGAPRIAAFAVDSV